jgi:hypothetical protein
MRVSPVPYIRGARPRGSVFEMDSSDDCISCIDTQFFVDHTEPMSALERARHERPWLLGELQEGCEWVLMFRSKRMPKDSLMSPRQRTVTHPTNHTENQDS